MNLAREQLAKLVTEAIENQDPGALALHDDIQERLHHCPCAKNVLVLIAELFNREGARAWALCLSQSDRTDETRVKARGLLHASDKIKGLLRGKDA